MSHTPVYWSTSADLTLGEAVCECGTWITTSQDQTLGEAISTHLREMQVSEAPEPRRGELTWTQASGWLPYDNLADALDDPS